jgi:predicted porin
MNKKLIAAAVAAGLAVPAAAQAGVTPYAQVQFEIANIDNGTTSAISVTDQQRGRVGLKGSEDLGDGLKAFAKVEVDIEGGNRDGEFGSTSRTDSNGDTYTVRNAFRIREVNAGLKGSFGEVSIGTVKSAYKYTGGVKYDPFVTTTLEARGNGGMTGGIWGHNGFLSDAITYKNKFDNLTFWVTYSPDERDEDGDGQSDDGEMSASLKYSGKGFEVFVATVDNNRSLSSYDSTKFGGQWKGGAHKVSAQIESTSSGATDIDTYFVGYNYKFDKNIFVAQIGNSDNSTTSTDYMTIGLIHKYSKKTRLFVGYRSSDPDTGNESTSTSVGLRVDF